MLSAKAIVAAAQAVTGIGVSELWGESKHQKVVAARTAMVGVARRRTTLSFPEINREVLGRAGSHSTAVETMGRFNRDIDKATDAGVTLGQLADQIEEAADRLDPQYRLAVGQAWEGPEDAIWGRRREIAMLEPTRVRWENERGATCYTTREEFARWVATATPIDRPAVAAAMEEK